METVLKTMKNGDKDFNNETNNSTLYIIYGSRTGNSKAAATLAYEYANHLGIETELLDMKTFSFETLAWMRNILIAVSTHGEGDPPAMVENFYHFIHSDQSPNLKRTNFSVLALGDSSYKEFCKTGWDFRNRLLKLEAKEISPLVECDIDYEENAKKWVKEAVSAFEKILPETKKGEKKEFAFELNKRNMEQDNVFYTRVLEKKELTSVNSEKKILHFSLSMENFGTSYHPGDTFGVFVSNPRLLIDKLLKTMRFDRAYSIHSTDSIKLLKQVLLDDYEITLVTPVVLRKYEQFTKNEELRLLLSDENKLNAFCENHDVLDMVTLFPSEISPENFLSCLRPLKPRHFSVASSTLVFPDELHLTVGIIEYNLQNRLHKGVCSVYLDEQVEVGDFIPVFHEANESFSLPEDDSVPVIMIAAGTGIAPFRAFLQERKHRQAKGKNWLIFGDRHLESDFLYGNEFNSYYDSGILTQMDLAFSRDQKMKKYVQHCILEKSETFFEWIDSMNAVVYLCGNKRTIGREVKEAIKFVIEKEGNLSSEKAEEFIQQMTIDKKLLSDLY